MQYRPAAHNQLGGDWCDAVKLPDGRAAFVVGDVAGHGFRAASTMTQIRTAVRAYLLEGHSPGSCLDKLDHLVASTMDGVTATAAVLVVDVATGDATVASAGHPSPLLVHDGLGGEGHLPQRAVSKHLAGDALGAQHGAHQVAEAASAVVKTIVGS